MKKSANKNLSFEENTVIEPVETEDSVQTVIRWRPSRTINLHCDKMLLTPWNVYIS